MHSKIFIPRDETPKSVVIAVPSSIIISMLLLSDLWRCQHQLLAAKLKDENMTGKCLELWIMHKNRRDTWSSLILGEYTGIFSSDLCFSKIYFRCCSDLKAEWGEEQQVLSGGPTPRDKRCSWSNEHRCSWKGQDAPTSTEFLAQSLCEYKCNAEKEKLSCFTASHIFLLVLHPPVFTGGIWESQALAHTAVVYNNSSAAIWFHESLYLKMGRSVMKATSLVL